MKQKLLALLLVLALLLTLSVSAFAEEEQQPVETAAPDAAESITIELPESTETVEQPESIIPDIGSIAPFPVVEDGETNFMSYLIDPDYQEFAPFTLEDGTQGTAFRKEGWLQVQLLSGDERTVYSWENGEPRVQGDRAEEVFAAAQALDGESWKSMDGTRAKPEYPILLEDSYVSLRTMTINGKETHALMFCLPQLELIQVQALVDDAPCVLRERFEEQAVGANVNELKTALLEEGDHLSAGTRFTISVPEPVVEEEVNVNIDPQPPVGFKLPLWAIILIGAVAVLLVAGVVMLLLLRRKKNRESARRMEEMAEAESFRVPTVRSIGQLSNIGRRKTQQDSKGVISFGNQGVLAVVADGMGGLSDGDKVSQKIVMTMMQDGSRLEAGKTSGMLYQMVAHANQEVNRMLGSANQYKCGSTLLAVLVEPGCFQWAAVGDSHIYLYRGHQLLQINREHILMIDLLNKAVNGEINFREVMSDPQVKRVSSFIGMGRLKYVDGSTQPILTCPGDRLVLMSDGVFNTLSESEICGILESSPNAEAAAAKMEEQVLLRNNPNQDNFTAVILEL